MSSISFYPWIFLLKLRTEDSELNCSFQKDRRWRVSHLTVSDFFLTVNNFYILRVSLADTSVDPPPLLTESGWDGSSRRCLADFHQLHVSQKARTGERILADILSNSVGLAALELWLRPSQMYLLMRRLFLNYFFFFPFKRTLLAAFLLMLWSRQHIPKGYNRRYFLN